MTVVHVSLIVGVLIAAVLIGHLLRQRRSPAATIGWIIFMVSAPWLAVPVYLTLGTRKFKMAPRPTTYDPPVNTSPLARLLASAGVPPAREGNKVHWHDDGPAAWDALLATLASATHTLDIVLFVLRDDSYGRRFMTALASRAQAGVEVRLLLDGVGSLLIARSALRQLRAAGVQTAWFVPLLHRPFRGRTNLRNHRKLVIADRTRAWTGGRNVANEYFVATARWIDLSFTLEGPVVADLADLFATDWRFAYKRAGTPPSRHIAAATGASTVQVVPSGPALARDTLHELMLTACYGAQRRLWLATPYFVPDEALQQALTLAARRGVDIRIVLPLRSNHRLADWARARYLRELGSAGARLLAVPDAMMHAKALIADELALAGSANADVRSLFLNFELDCLFCSETDVDALARWFESTAAQAVAYRPPPDRWGRGFVEGVVLLAAFQI